MSTITKLVIEMMADPQGVKTGLDKAEGYLRQFGKTADQALATSKRGAAGQALADNIIGGMQDRFAASADRVREQLFRGILDPKVAAEHARQAAQAMNTTILATLAELRTRGLATPEIEHQLIGQLSNTGLAMEQAGTRGALGLSRIRNGLTSLIANFTGTIPVLDRIGVALGSFGVGTEVMLGAVAGIAVLAYAWYKYTEHQREATKAMEEFQKSAEAMGAASRAAASIGGIAAGAGFNSVKALPLTEEIKKAQLAAEGLKSTLASARPPVFFATGTSAQIAAYERALAAGKLTTKQFADEMAALARTREGAINAQAIADATALAAQYKAAGEMVDKLTAAEQQRHAVEVSNRATFGTAPTLGEELDNVNRRLTAVRAGGDVALHAVEDTIAATDKASTAWQAYVQTADGAKYSTLAFRDALAAHNVEAVKMYGAAVQIEKGQRAISETVKSTPIQKAKEFAEHLIRTKEALEKIGDNGHSLDTGVVAAFGRLNALLFQQKDLLSDNALIVRTMLADLQHTFLSFPLPAFRNPLARGNANLTTAGIDSDLFSPALQAAAALAGRVINGRDGTGEIDPVTGRRRGQIDPLQIPLNAITAATLPKGPATGPTINQARFRDTVTHVEESLQSLGGHLKDLASSTFFGILKSIAGQLNPFAQIVTSLSVAAKPLVPFMTQLGNIVANVLGPVFKAFAPVLQSLLPLFDAIFRVLSPILRALAPLFGALVPILNALFPVIKLAAVAFTYVVQAASFLAGIFFNIAGAFTVLVGGVIAAIGAIISKIPFLGGFGKSIQDAGNGVKNLGKGMEQTANALFETSRSMDDARKEIDGVNLDPTQTALDGLAKSANAATGSLLNVPTGYKVALARFLATAPAPSAPPLTPTPPHTPASPTGGKFGVTGGGGGSGGSGDGGSGGGTGDGGDGSGGRGGSDMAMQFAQGAIVIMAGDKSAPELADELLAEFRRRARAQFGDANRWGEIS